MIDKENLVGAVDRTLRHYNMLSPGEGVLVAVSGGPDSVALLHVLAALRDAWSLRLVAAYLDHQIRGAEAREDGRFVEAFAARLAVPCVIGSENVKGYCAARRLSLQEGARVVRYGFLERTADQQGTNKIALAHQADDNAESILINLLRGAGAKGLAGIPPVRGGRLIRPLIDSTREQILDYLQRQGLAFVEDRSNLDERYLRNRVRHELLPLLRKRFNPRIEAGLVRLADILRTEEDYWEKETAALFGKVCLETSGREVALSLSGLRVLHPAMLRRVIRLGLFSLKGDLRRVAHEHVRAVTALINAPGPEGEQTLPEGVTVRKTQGRLSIHVRDEGEIPRYDYELRFDYELRGPGEFFIPEIDAMLLLTSTEAEQIGDLRTHGPNVGLFDMDALSFPLRVRNVVRGDRFRPLGAPGSQKVATFLINRKVPRGRRRLCPILVSDGRIIWVGGHRIDESAKVTPHTRKVLKAELIASSAKRLK